MRKKSSIDKVISILIFIIIICVIILFFKHYVNVNEIYSKFENSKYNIPIFNIESSLNIINDEDLTESSLNNYKYYYNQLNDTAKKIYNSIESNIENIQSGTYIISIPENVGKVLEKDDGEEILNNAFQSAWDAIIMDNVELFYIDVSKITLEIKTTTYGKKKTYNLSMKPNQSTYLEDNFDNEEKVKKAIMQVRNIRSQIVSAISGNDYEKIVMVNEILVKNLEYGSLDENNNAYSIYGALTQRECVCEGYAEAFKYIMDELNIPCILVIGNAKNSDEKNESHEWNYVELDGNWYAMDVTWNDPIVKGGITINSELKSKYLLKGVAFNSNHYPNGRVSENGIEFSYPELSLNDYK